MTTDIRIERFDPRTAGDELLAAAHAVVEAWELEDDPEEEPIGLAELIAERRNPPAYLTVPHWAALDGSTPVGLAALEIYDVPDNRRMAEIEVDVVAGARRRGIGTALLREALAGAAEVGRDLPTLYAAPGSPGEAFLGRYGFSPRQTERQSRLLIADLDVAQLEGWVKQAAERAGDYSLIDWVGPPPEEHLQEFAQLSMVMNTAPIDDLEFEPMVISPERTRQQHADHEARGRDHHVICARHDPSGALVGFTEVGVNRFRRHLAEQGDTAVDPAHRNRGIGRWLKAAMALRLLDRYPDLRSITTFNAESNDPMLTINVAMGFRPYRAYVAYQADAAVVREALAEHR